MASYKPIPIQRDSVISRAAEEICRMIEANDMGPGQLLPTEQRLSQMLGISRNSLREALRILDGLGFVEKRPGKGIVVKASFGRSAATPSDDSLAVKAAPVAFQVRMIVEGECAQLATQLRTEEDLAELAAHLQGFEGALKRGDLVAAAQAHLAFHDALVATARNPILAAIFQQVRFAVSEIARRGGLKTSKNRRHLSAHWAIYHALRARDSEKAAAAVVQHFQVLGPLIEFMSQSRRPIPD